MHATTKYWTSVRLTRLLRLNTKALHQSPSFVNSSKYFGTRKCCHPQISDLVIRLVFFRESSRKIINKLTSRLPSCESSIPGRFALFECNSNDVRICKKISQESCHQEIMKPKSDICGWQHLWGPKDLLNSTDPPSPPLIKRSGRSPCRNEETLQA